EVLRRGADAILHHWILALAAAHALLHDGIGSTAAMLVGPQLRALGRRALRVASHPVEHLHPLLRVVRAARDAFERVTLRAIEQAVLHLRRARPADEPFAVGELRGEVLRLAKLQIELR